MDLKQLAYFVHVVDAGGFSRAARVLGIAQPAVSRLVRSLEVELRQSLLLRNGRGAMPTEAGKRLLEHARGILQQVDRARREVAETKGAPVGHVVVGLPPTLARHLTVPLVRAFRERFPRASIAIVEGLSATIHEWLLVGRVDVGLVYNPVASPAVQHRTLLREQLCLVGPARGPWHASGAAKAAAGVTTGRSAARTVRLRDLPRYPLIIPGRPNAIRTLVETELAALGAKPQVALEIDAVPAILELVAEGYGYAVLSPRAVERTGTAPALQSRSIVQPRLESTLAIATSAQRPSTPVQQAAIALIEALAGEQLAPPATACARRGNLSRSARKGATP